ncbi:MAG: class I SAM-dependent methyltransferase [Thermoguttaceae bacterium]
MQTRELMSKIGKGLLTVNLAAVLRLALHGFDSLDRRLSRAYHVIDPFDAGDPAYTPAITYYDMLPEIHLSEIVHNFVSINLGGTYRFVDGAMPWVDLVALLTIMHDRQPKCMFEIGTFFGYTTRVCAMNFPATTIHTIDLPESFDQSTDAGNLPKDDFHLIKSRRVGEAFRSDASVRNIIQHYGDTATWDFQQVKDATLFFIDGSHTYEYVRNDTEKCLAVCKDRRATILWHDCDRAHPGVLRYLAELVQAQFPIKHIGWTHLAILDI